MNIEIENSKLGCIYCRDIEDKEEIYKHITDDYWAHWYCRHIKNRPEVYKHITGKKLKLLAG